MAIYGIDVSSWQSTNESLKGYDFCFVKATEGTHYVNPKQEAQAAHARKAGLIVGFYHFVRPGDIKAQAKYFVEKCASLEHDPLVLDWEDAGVSNADKNTFIAEVKRLRGSNHRVGLYCNTNFWLNKDKGSECGDFLWIAHYGRSPGKPGITDAWLIHQYTEDPIDKNYAKWSSRADMRKWADMESSGSTPKPTPKPAPKPVASQAAKVISIAKGENGYREGANNYTKYPPAVPTLGWAQNQPWCQTFQAWVALKAGTASIEPRTASCLVATNWFKNKGRFSEYPAIGAHVFFGPGGGTHVGRVYRYDANYVWTVEGNTNTSGSANGNGVYLRKRARRDSYLHGYGMPAFKEGVTTADPSRKGKAGYHYAATASAPTSTAPQSLIQEAESMSAEKLNATMWDMDNMPAPPSASTYDSNKTWKASSYLKELYERNAELRGQVSELTAKVDALTTVVGALDLDGFVTALESLKLSIDVTPES